VNNPKTFAETFEEIRKRKNISQTAIARGARMLTTAIGRIVMKQTDPQLATVVALATGLRLTIWDRETFALLRSAGYTLSDLSPHDRALLENWPKNEGLRVSIDTIRMQVSIADLLAADLINLAPNEEMLETSREIHFLLQKAASLGNRLNRQFEAHQGPTPSFSGYRKYRKPGNRR